MSTQYLVNAVLMELAVHCKHARVVPLVSWAPRLCNREPDDLASVRTEAFSPAQEVKLEPDELHWHVLPQVLAMGQEADDSGQGLQRDGDAPKSRYQDEEEKTVGAFEVDPILGDSRSKDQ